MPDTRAGAADDGPAEHEPADDAPAEGEPDRGSRSPGWREVLLVAALVLGAVLAAEILSSLLPPLREALRAFPVTIVALVVGTVGVLVLIAVRRPRP
ncbi:MAG: hypothetical protein MUE92_00450 [Chloroflexi bacterium]|nr:hypothetical protein [Chloroflexota bacterium]